MRTWTSCSAATACAGVYRQSFGMRPVGRKTFTVKYPESYVERSGRQEIEYTATFGGARQETPDLTTRDAESVLGSIGSLSFYTRVLENLTKPAFRVTAACATNGSSSARASVSQSLKPCRGSRIQQSRSLCSTSMRRGLTRANRVELAANARRSHGPRD